MKSLYGNTGTPITLDMGMFKVFYREPLLGGNRLYQAKVATLMDAVASFNLHKGGFDTPLSVERIDMSGEMTHRWNLDGRYSVPRLVGGTVTDRPRRQRRSTRR